MCSVLLFNSTTKKWQEPITLGVMDSCLLVPLKGEALKGKSLFQDLYMSAAYSAQNGYPGCYQLYMVNVLYRLLLLLMTCNCMTAAWLHIHPFTMYIALQ